MKRIKIFNVVKPTDVDIDDSRIRSETPWTEVTDEEYDELQDWIGIKCRRDFYKTEHYIIVCEDTQSVIENYISDYQKLMEKDKKQQQKQKIAIEKRKEKAKIKKLEQEKRQYEELRKKFG